MRFRWTQRVLLIVLFALTVGAAAGGLAVAATGSPAAGWFVAWAAGHLAVWVFGDWMLS